MQGMERFFLTLCSVALVVACSAKEPPAPSKEPTKKRAQLAPPAKVETPAPKPQAQVPSAADPKAAASPKALRQSTDGRARASHPGQRAGAQQVSWSDPTVCDDCHPKETERYLKTGMGTSLYRPQSFKPIENFAPRASTVKHPQMPVQYRAFIDAQGRWWQEEQIPMADFVARVEVKYVVGSGDHGRAYLGERGGQLIRLPLTWHTKEQVWGLSPGYEGKDNPRLSGVVEGECLFCHNSFTTAAAGGRGRYLAPLKQGIGCERCHGDARAHVKARTAGLGPPVGAPDPTILNPRRLSPARGLQICEQCHLQGAVRVLREGERWDAFDPTRPLETYLTTYVPENSASGQGGASHADQLSRSACATQSGPALRCTTCHKPHVQDLEFASGPACRGCHGLGTDRPHLAKGCKDGAGRKKDANCARCHMGRSTGTHRPHLSFTDHHIRIRPQRIPPPGAAASARGALVAARPFGGKAAAAGLDLGTAHALLGFGGGGEASHLTMADKILSDAKLDQAHGARSLTFLGRIRLLGNGADEAALILDRAVKIDPQNPKVHRARAEVYLTTGRLQRAEESAKRVVALDPYSGEGWSVLAQVHQAARDFESADAAWARAAETSPFNSVVVSQRGFNALNSGRIKAAERVFARALGLDPMNEAAPFGLAPILAQRGKMEAAEGLMMRTALIYPQLAPAHLFLARFARARDDVDAAVARYQVAIRHDPKGPTAHRELIALALEVGQLDAAAEWRDRALRHIPDLELPPLPPQTP